MKIPSGIKDEQDTEASKGDQARAALILAAIDVFGESSLEDATTREIARRSGQNIASIAYYFGNKEGLYQAAVGAIGERMNRILGPKAAEIEAELDLGSLSRPRILRRVQELFSLLVAQGLLRPEGVSMSRIVIREMSQPTEAFALIFDGRLKRLHGLVALLVSRYLGRDSVDAETIIFTHTVWGQVLGFRAGRELFLRMVGWNAFDDGARAAISAVIAENIELLLKGRLRLEQRRKKGLKR